MITQKYLTDLTYVELMELVLKFTKSLGSGLAEIVYHKALKKNLKSEI